MTGSIRGWSRSHFTYTGWLRKLTLQSPSITVNFRNNDLKIANVFIILQILPKFQKTKHQVVKAMTKLQVMLWLKISQPGGCGQGQLGCEQGACHSFLLLRTSF